LLETDVPRDDAIVVSAGKLRKLWDSLSKLRSSQCERRLERTLLRPACQNCTIYSAFCFPSDMTSHSKIAQFNWERIGRFTYTAYCLPFVSINSFRCNNCTTLHLNMAHQPDLHISIHKIKLGYLTSSEYLRLWSISSASQCSRTTANVRE
jgi:hypothetical protein